MGDPEAKTDGVQMSQEQAATQQFGQFDTQVQSPPVFVPPPLPPSLVSTIERNSEAVVNQVMSRRAGLAPGQKLVVGLGELHEDGAHVVLEHVILHKLIQRGLKCAFALEWPPNNIDMHIDDEMDSQVTDKSTLKAFLNLPGNAALRNKLSCDTTPIRTSNARLSRTVLHQYIDNHGIPIFCADAQRDWSLYFQNDRSVQHLLAHEPKTQAAIEEAAHILQIKPGETGYPPVDALNQFGMLARNIYLLHQAEQIIEDFPYIDVVFLEAGSAHITGNDKLTPDPSPYSHGLSSLFSWKSGHVFIGAPFFNSANDRDYNMPVEAVLDQSILTLEPLDKMPFNVVSSNVSDKSEAKMLGDLAPYFDCIGETLEGDDARVLRECRKQRLLNTLERIRDDNQLLLMPPAPSH